MSNQQIITKYQITKHRSGPKTAFNAIASELGINTKNTTTKEQNEPKFTKPENKTDQPLPMNFVVTNNTRESLNKKSKRESQEIERLERENAMLEKERSERKKMEIEKEQAQKTQIAKENIINKCTEIQQIDIANNKNIKHDTKAIFTFILNEPEEKKQIKELINSFSGIFRNMETIIVNNNSGEELNTIKNNFNDCKINEFININDIEYN